MSLIDLLQAGLKNKIRLIGLKNKVSVDAQKPLLPNHLGEIWPRGPNMMQGVMLIASIILSSCGFWEIMHCFI